MWLPVQMGFHEFMSRCEVLDADADVKLAHHGKLSARDIQKMKVRAAMHARRQCHPRNIKAEGAQFLLHASPSLLMEAGKCP